MVFDPRAYDDTYVLHCKTMEQAEIFCDVMNEHGYRLASGSTYDGKQWSEVNSCYRWKAGLVCSRGFYEKRGRKILEFDDFEWFETNETAPSMDFSQLFDQ